MTLKTKNINSWKNIKLKLKYAFLVPTYNDTWIAIAFYIMNKKPKIK